MSRAIIHSDELVRIKDTKLYVVLDHFIDSARDKIRYNLENDPTHEHCNSNCDDCVKRVCCVWSPYHYSEEKVITE